jgi:hypothetical protein
MWPHSQTLAVSRIAIVDQLSKGLVPREQPAPAEPSDLAKLGEHFGVEVGANPEARDPDQVIQHRSRRVNQSLMLCVRDQWILLVFLR